MDLLEDIGRSYRTGVKVESDEDEAAMMVFAVFADVLPLHGSHIGTKGERPVLGAGASATTADHGVKDQTVEVADFGRVANPAEGCGRDRR